MKRDVDGGLRCEMLRHERIELGHDGLNVQRIFLQEQRRIVLLDNQRGLCSGLAVARFVLACADAAGAIAGMNADEQIFRRLHAPFARDAQQNHFHFIDNMCHMSSDFSEPSLCKSKRSLTGDHSNVQEALARISSCTRQTRGIYSRRFDNFIREHFTAKDAKLDQEESSCSTCHSETQAKNLGGVEWRSLLFATKSEILRRTSG